MNMENVMRKSIVAAAACLILSPLVAVAQNTQGQPNPFQGGSNISADQSGSNTDNACPGSHCCERCDRRQPVPL